MQLVGDECQHAFSVPLRGIAAFPAVPAQLFQSVVQFFHGSSLSCVLSCLVSVSLPLAAEATQVHLRDMASWDTTPSMTCSVPQSRQHRWSPVGDGPLHQVNVPPSGRFSNMGIPSFYIV